MKLRTYIPSFLNLSDEEKHKARIINYALSLLEKVCNTYEIKSDLLYTPSATILKYAFINGHCGLVKLEDGLYHCGIGSYVGSDLDTDGFSKRYLITFENGKTYEGEIGKDIIVLWWNNLAHGQAELLSWFSEMLADTDLSMKYNIKYTRVCPIPIVTTDVERKSIEDVLKNLFNGCLKVFKRTSSADLLNNNNKVSNTLDLTTPQASEYMQHLSRFHDELIQRVCLEFGVYVSVRDKGAQLNNAELGAFSDYCAISSDDTYNQLLKWSEECKKVFGIEIEVKPKAYIYTEKDVKDNEDGAEIENVSRETLEESEGDADESERDLEK